MTDYNLCVNSAQLTSPISQLTVARKFMTIPVPSSSILSQQCHNQKTITRD